MARSRRRVALFAALPVLALVVAVAWSSGAARAQAQVPAPADRPTTANTSLAAENELARLQRTAEAKFTAIYGSLAVSASGVTVYLTQPRPAAERTLRDLGGPLRVRFAVTASSRVRLLAVHQRLTAAFGRLQARGIRLVTWFPGVNGDGREHVGVLNLTRNKAAVLDRLLGARNVVLGNVTRSEIPRSTASRNIDSAPWNGGDNETSAGEGCTAGAGISYHGTQYMITAAHCYPLGASVYNEFPGVSRPNNLMGTVSSRDETSGGDDTELVKMSVSGHIWTGVIGSPSLVAVAGDTTNPVGDTVYNEGAFSGQVAVTVTSNTGCISTNERDKECNIVTATSTGIANQAGDSGGPVIRYIGGKLMITGIVSAGSNPATCQYNTQYSNSCYHTIYYTAMDEILSTEYAGASLIG